MLSGIESRVAGRYPSWRMVRRCTYVLCITQLNGLARVSFIESLQIGLILEIDGVEAWSGVEGAMVDAFTLWESRLISRIPSELYSETARGQMGSQEAPTLHRECSSDGREKFGG